MALHNVSECNYIRTGCGLSYHKRCAYKIPKNCSNIRKSQFYRHVSVTDSISNQSVASSMSSATVESSLTVPPVLQQAPVHLVRIALDSRDLLTIF